MQESGQKIVEGFLSAAERERVPRNGVAIDEGGLEALVVDLQGAADRRRGIDNDDRGATGVRIDVHEAIEADLESAFLAGFADGGVWQRLTTVHVTAGEDPLPVARLDGATHQDQPLIVGADDRADGHLGVQVEHEAAGGADQANGIALLQETCLERTAAARTEAIGVGVLWQVLLGHGCGPVAAKYNSARMSILKVARMGHPVLRAKAKALDRSTIRTPMMQKLIDDMIETMNEYHGVGLAAPQIHEGIRLFVAALDTERGEEPSEPIALINPEITPVGTEVREDWEGCLSIPDIRGKVPRHVEIRVKALDRDGERVELRARGFSARIIQHETDHLDGILFFDRMKAFDTLTFLDEYSRYWVKNEDEE